MEPIVLVTSLLRLLLVGVVYSLNAFAFIKLISRISVTGACVHVITTAAVLLAGLLYLSSWAPYLVYSLTDGQWILLGANSHCLLQHFVTSEISSILLAILTVRVLYRYLYRVQGRQATTAKAASLATCIAWLGPQLLYDAMTANDDNGSTIRNDNRVQESSYRFLDDVMEVHQRRFNESTRRYRIGFMVCLQNLDARVLSSFIWQYTVVVLPLSIVVLFCGMRLLLGSKRYSSVGHQEAIHHTGPVLCTKKDVLVQVHAGKETPARLPEELKLSVDDSPTEMTFTDISGYSYSPKCSCLYRSGGETCARSCYRDTLVDMALYYNLIWLLVLRPLAVLHAVYLQNAGNGRLTSTGGASYIDIGSHLVLTFSVVFSPFSPRVSLCKKLGLYRSDLHNQCQSRCEPNHRHYSIVDSTISKDLKDTKEDNVSEKTKHDSKAAILESSGESFC